MNGDKGTKIDRVIQIQFNQSESNVIVSGEAYITRLEARADVD